MPCHAMPLVGGGAQGHPREEFAFLDPTSLVLRAIADMCASGEPLPHETAAYLEKKVNPLLRGIVDLVMEQMPESPEMAVLLWLRKVAHVPESTAARVREWAAGLKTADSLPEWAAGLETVDSLPELPREGPLCRRRVASTPGSPALIAAEARQRPVEQEEMLAAVQRVHFFKSFEEATLRKLCVAATVTSFVDGEEVLRVGSVGAAVHVVLEGQAKVSVLRESCRYVAGDAFGYTELLNREASVETIEAIGGHVNNFVSARRFIP